MVGAPLGSMLLTPKLRSFLRALFYLLAVVQFVTFALIKIRSPLVFAGIALGTTAVVLALVLHYRRSVRSAGSGSQFGTKETPWMCGT